MSGCYYINTRCWISAHDPDTGEEIWRTYTIPGEGEPGSETWGGAPLEARRGGSAWMPPSYDPELDLIFSGVGVPIQWGSVQRGTEDGAVLYTNSTIALDPDTGELVWGFQIMPHDTHDWDAAEVPVLVDAEFGGEPRRLLLQASRNGYYTVLDRATGENLLTRPFARVNWAERIDRDGRPIPDPDKEPARDGRLVSPDEGGGTNYRSPSFDPATGLLIVSAADAFGLYFFKPEHGDYGWAGASPVVLSRGFLRAIDYRTGAIRWETDLHGGAGAAGVLTTASGVTFTGDSASSAIALRTRDGATLWHSGIGRVGNAPISYELDGRQYVVIGAGSAVYAFALPQRLVSD
jgi:alcohol dehydrogenase (cytochrome c)